VSIIIVKHRQGLVTDCHQLPIVPMVPIVPQSAPIVSVADVSVKLYLRPSSFSKPISSLGVFALGALLSGLYCERHFIN